MAAQYPLPVFHFQVEWGGTRIGFTEVSGLDQELQPIEYREGSANVYSVTKMPGMPKFGNLTFKRGVMKADNDFAKWLTTVKLNQIERRDLSPDYTIVTRTLGGNRGIDRDLEASVAVEIPIRD